MPIVHIYEDGYEDPFPDLDLDVLNAPMIVPCTDGVFRRVDFDPKKLSVKERERLFAKGNMDVGGRDTRTLVISLLADEGVDFENCDSGADLCECILHSMLGMSFTFVHAVCTLHLTSITGWLSFYQSGYLHRDVSIGNVLKLAEPVKRKPFNIQNATDFVTALMAARQLQAADRQSGDSNSVADETTGLDDQQQTAEQQQTADQQSGNPNSVVNETTALDKQLRAIKGLHKSVTDKTKNLYESAMEFPNAQERLDTYIELAETARAQAELVMDLVSKLGVGDTCRAIITDGDLSASMPSYFVTDHEIGTISVS